MARLFASPIRNPSRNEQIDRYRQKARQIILCMYIDRIMTFLQNNVSIHRNFYQNRFINEYGRKKKAKISESQSPKVPDSQSHGVFQ